MIHIPRQQPIGCWFFAKKRTHVFSKKLAHIHICEYNGRDMQTTIEKEENL